MPDRSVSLPECAEKRSVSPSPPAAPYGPDPPTICTKAQRRKWMGLVVSYLSADLPLSVELITSPTKDASAALHRRLAEFFKSDPDGMLPPALERSSTSWALTVVSDPLQRPPDTPDLLIRAARSRQRYIDNQRTAKRQQIASVILFKDPVRMDSFARTIATFWVDDLGNGVEYPPKGHWIAEREEEYAAWDHYFAQQRRPDKRRGRQPVHLVDSELLQLVIPAEVSCYIRDRSSGDLVFAIIRNFCKIPGMIQFGRRVVADAVATRKNVRMEDTGSVVQVGFSAGSRRVPSFGFVRNLVSKAVDADTANREFSVLLTFFWLCSMGVFPSEIIDDFKAFYGEFDIPRLNPDWPSYNEAQGTLKLPPECGSYVFKDIELAPGCAVMVQRYARAVHREKQGHEWGLTWTILREGNSVHGGNFFLCKYGVAIKQSPNAAFAWKPSQFHSTSLASFTPSSNAPDFESLEYNQQAVAFVTSGRIRSVWAKWKNMHGLTGKQRVDGAIVELATPADKEDELYE
ncbi:hypothetical protein DFP72DRAFT_992945 [Ephemerocybe angulata]|uniref:Uncharacterized protein n=1 Tax=Ephemerocybe angulata TaxID=980116 RepID=A0A8H6HHA9_9AGAR|nr:hypothetical protein DFP72DRAFT_992945 [Tulosesus angulatus]